MEVPLNGDTGEGVLEDSCPFEVSLLEVACVVGPLLEAVCSLAVGVTLAEFSLIVVSVFEDDLSPRHCQMEQL